MDRVSCTDLGTTTKDRDEVKAWMLEISGYKRQTGKKDERYNYTYLCKEMGRESRLGGESLGREEVSTGHCCQ